VGTADDGGQQRRRQRGDARTHTTSPLAPPAGPATALPDVADVLLIAHPENALLGTRYRLTRGGSLLIGRSSKAGISLPDVPSVSRHHAKLEFADGITIEDLGSTNGTRVEDVIIDGPRSLSSGQRFQVGAVHFKLLHDRDVEQAYHVAVYELMMRDGLTQLFNRRKFDEEAHREWLRAERYRRPLALVLFDVDHFKRVNDTHGHLQGDAVLQRIAATARDVTRTEQVVARVGGEEFAVLCPEVDGEGAWALAERLRAAIADLEHAGLEEPFRVTCSFGVASSDKPFASFAEMYDGADRALYASKEGGRDRVTVAGAS
jgi:two-component system cell cycle response regulator